MGRIRFSGLLLALVLLLSGCGRTAEQHNQQLFAMDTFMSFTAYGGGADEALAEASAQVTRLESLLSVTEADSELYAINHAQGGWTQVSPETLELLQTALQLCAATDGALDITAYPAVRAWGFTTGEHRVPGAEELAALTGQIDYTAVEVDAEQNRVRLPAGMELDLGAVAKGWAGQAMAAVLQERGVESAILSLGGNIQAVGPRPDGKPWVVGVQDPDSETGESLATLAVTDRAVITSGGYQRFFEQDGEIYWHILDPDTAAPARSGLVSVTIVTENGAQGDALSTALFVMGEEKAADYWRAHPDFQAVLVREDGGVLITQGLEDTFALAEDYQDRKVTVIMP